MVQDLAEKLACNSGDVLKVLFMKGIMAQVNQVTLVERRVKYNNYMTTICVPNQETYCLHSISLALSHSIFPPTLACHGLV